MKKLVLLLTLILGIQSVICSADIDPNSSSNASATNYELRVMNDKINNIDHKIEKMEPSVQYSKTSCTILWALIAVNFIVSLAVR